MIFNTSYRLGKILEPLSQEEILNTPEFYAMSLEGILESGRCPDHLRRVLLELEWGNRPTVVQVRPQDFRFGHPHILGTGWHVDVNTVLMNGTEHKAKSLDEFYSMVVSFGDVAETEFIKGPLEINRPNVDPYDHCGFADLVNSLKFETVTAFPNQMATYTSRDIHRINPKIRRGNMRLIIVTFECDEAVDKNGGQIRPSIREKS